MASLPENEGIIEDLRRRISRANKWRYLFLFLMPLGFVIPCAIGLVLGRSNPKPEGFTLAQAFGVAALALPVVAFGGWLLLAGDRRKYLESLAVAKEADSLGFHFSEKAPKRLMKQLRSFRMFKDADDHFGLNCVSGKKMGRAFALLEYRTAYRTGVNPYDSKLNIQTVVVVFGLDKNLPDFRIGPKTWLSRLLRAFGARTIEISGQAKFSRKFLVCGNDENSVRQAVNSDVIQLILDADGTLEVRDDALLFYRHNLLEEPENYRDMIGLAGRLAKAICG